MHRRIKRGYWEDNDKRTGRNSGFTLKVDNEIVGRTKHRDHTHARVCSRCLLSHKEDELGLAATGNRMVFFLSEKKKEASALFLFLHKERHQSY